MCKKYNFNFLIDETCDFSLKYIISFNNLSLPAKFYFKHIFVSSVIYELVN